MPGTAEPDGSEDVNDFLQRIKELGDQRDKEDEERTRKLEEEILQGRKERQARRAERARSLSPTKEPSSYSGTPGSVRSNNDSSMLDDLSKTPSLSQPSTARMTDMDEGPRKLDGAASRPDAQGSPIPSRELPHPAAKPQNMSSISPSAAMAPSRSTTLSWQHRPSSRGSTAGTIRSQPMSAVASESNPPRSPPPTSSRASKADESISKSQIAQSLGAKDPDFFRQTQDRGLASAAYRRHQVEDLSDINSIGGSMRLPGLSRETSTDAEAPKNSIQVSRDSAILPREDSVRGHKSLDDRYKASHSMSSSGGFRSPLPASNSQRFDPPPSDTASSHGSGDATLIGRTMAMSPSQGRLSPERIDRPASPTKGLGGFVQSAMMKRSDSVNKRWSAQGGPGLSRGSSVTSNSGPVRFPVGGVTPLAESRNSASRETTPSVNSRPSSSHDSANVTQTSTEDDRDAIGLSLRMKKSEAPGPMSPPGQTSISAPQPQSPTKIEPMMSPPSSPSKRWSPTKSSWLENAISKPDSPKILSPAVSQQPAWMADLNRNKQQRGSVDLGKSSAFKEVAVGGFVRSPPPGTGHKPPTIGGLPSGFSSGGAVKSRTGSSDDIRRTGSPEPMRQTDKLSGSSTAPDLSRAADKASAGDREPAPSSFKPSTSPSASLISTVIDPSTAKPKAKPETPPKKDFRTALKPRQTSGEGKNKDEPEFKNVFGKLKKTQTQNYVAPDELKDNIMRGKTGLAKTDGPQKSNIKDEFKESILKKKERMVAPSASTRITSASSKNPDTSTPEAIAKRRDLGRSDSTVSNGSVEEKKPAPKPEALTKLQSLQEKTKIVSSEKAPEKYPHEQNSQPAKEQQKLESKAGLGGNFASMLGGILQRGPSPIGGAAKPPPATQDSDLVTLAAARTAPDPEPRSGPELTHATKGRARGPKRKPPTAVKQEAIANSKVSPPEPQPKPTLQQSSSVPGTAPKLQPAQESSSPRPLSVITNNSNHQRPITQPNTPLKPSTSTAKPLDDKAAPFIGQSPIHEKLSKSSPIVAQKPMQSPTISHVQKPIPSTSQSPIQQSPIRSSPIKNEPKANDASISKELEEQEPQQPLPSVKGMADTWGQSPQSAKSRQPKSPVKLPTRKDEEAAMVNAGLRPKEPVGLGIETPTRAAEVLQHEVVPLSIKSPKSPPLPGKKPAAIDIKSSATSMPSPGPPKRTTSPIKESSEATKLFTDIFDEAPTSKRSINIDTQAVLDLSASKDQNQKIKTLRKQIFEITENGKSLPVPSHQEHILFEDSLYLCTHVFGAPSGTRTTEVYLWCGDGVSSSAIEDAQLFAKKSAKDSSGKLMLLRQGKETSNFFQALGGIVITRKGSSSRSDSATYMLCGRQHLGQIAFDEVAFDPQSLCRGFPYIISARGGRLYLWKGSGAGADELGCARLIGMDLGLTGEIEEIDEGKEPSEFWSSFPSGTAKGSFTASSSRPWHLKPACEKYATKLFEVDVETPRPKSSSGFMSWGRRESAPANNSNVSMEAKIRELTPFSQADMVDEGVYVLDAFFEIFVIHPLRTSLFPAPQHRSTKALSFRAALLFAQDYGILAASAEDRPFVPHSSVVIMSKHDGGPRGIGAGEVPEGLKRCFRKWDGNGVGGGDIRILSLTDALASEEN